MTNSDDGTKSLSVLNLAIVLGAATGLRILDGCQLQQFTLH